jgi:hypothetical protein
MKKIQRVSYWFRVLLQGAFVLLPLLLIIFWVNAPIETGFPQAGFGISFIPKDMIHPIMHSLSVETKIYGFLISLIPYGLLELIIFFLIRLFGLYEKAEIFTLKSVTYLKKIGYTLFLTQLLNPIYSALITLNLTWGNPVGHRYIGITVDAVNLSIMLLALLMILIAWIMAEACKLSEEQQLTV